MIPVYPDTTLIPSLRELWKLSFGDTDEFLDNFFRTGYDSQRCRCVVSEGQAAAALYWFDASYQGRKYAYLYAVATHPDFRHQGIIHYLIADTHKLLTELGYAGAMLVPADEGLRRMYAAMGYEDCTTVSQFVTASLPETVAMHAINRQEYQQLRPRFLPQDGMVQEGAGLDFLETMAKFYTGPDFLLCCTPQDQNTLRGIEFLGNPGAAAGILCSLGYPQGVFLTPGQKLPYAMLCPLQKDCPRPGYLGLALD